MRYGIRLTVLATAATLHCLGACLTAGNSPAYPLKLGVSGRYLADQNDVPFMILGDSPQSAIGKLSPSDADWYFANRQTHGFNTLWINLLCNKTTGCNADGTTFDGIAPFLSSGDLATPNQAYFGRVDEMLQLAAKHGLIVMLDTAETSVCLDLCALMDEKSSKISAFISANATRLLRISSGLVAMISRAGETRTTMPWYLRLLTGFALSTEPHSHHGA